MKLALRLFAPILLLTVVFLAAGRPAQAQVSLTLQPGTQSGVPGQTLVFTGTVQNLGSAPVFLNGDLFTPSTVPGLTFDDSPFFNNAPSELLAAGDPDAIYTGPLFNVTIDPSSSANIYMGTYQLIGGSDANANGPTDIVATSPFQVAAAPEPSSLTLLSVGSLFVIGLSTARRKRALR